MAKYLTVGKTSDIAPGTVRVFDVDGQAVAVLLVVEGAAVHIGFAGAGRFAQVCLDNSLEIDRLQESFYVNAFG